MYVGQQVARRTLGIIKNLVWRLNTNFSQEKITKHIQPYKGTSYVKYATDVQNTAQFFKKHMLTTDFNP